MITDNPVFNFNNSYLFSLKTVHIELSSNFIIMQPIVKYFPQLDGIRTIAIGLVLVHHWLPSNHFINKIPNGSIGVTLFFVLSGYLINDILLKNRVSSWGGFCKVYQTFIIRRTLRIFPIYFITLAVVTILPKLSLTIETDFYTHPIYYLTYTYNHLLDKTNNWQDALSPYWTLAVEEQFYIIWAVIILLVSNNQQTKIFLWATVVLGIIFRFYFVSLQKSHGLITITCIDSFAWGGVFALYKLENKQDTLQKILKYLSVPSFLLFLYIVIYANSDESLIKVLFLRTTVACLSTYLILIVTQNPNNLVKKFLILKPMILLGKISYGIYVYHMIVPLLFGMVINRLRINLPIDSHLVSISILIIFSYFSFILIENPINHLKKYFHYPKAIVTKS